jgi:hypothetical protein
VWALLLYQKTTPLWCGSNFNLGNYLINQIVFFFFNAEIKYPISSSATTVTISLGTQSALTVTSTSGTYSTSVTLATSGGSGGCPSGQSVSR